MPHYKDGLKAEVGDVVIFPWDDGKTQPPERAGVLASITPGSDSCNGSAMWVEFHDVPGTLPYNLRAGWPTQIALPGGSLRVPQVGTTTATIGEMTLLYRPGVGDASAVASKAINDVLDAKLKMAEAAADGLVGPDGEKVEVPRGILPADGQIHGEPLQGLTDEQIAALPPLDPAAADAPAEVGFSYGSGRPPIPF